VVGGAPEGGEARDTKAAKPKTRAPKAAAKPTPRPRTPKPLARTAVKKASATKTKPAPAATVAKKATSKQATAKKAGPKKARPRKAASTKPSAARARSKAGAARAGAARRRGALTLPEGPRSVPGLSEEDQIRAAKYLPRELPKRVFEEERFLFPESYGQNRVRLLVRDPEWIFAYWDVKPESLEELAKSMGERALALSRLTLRVVDPVSGGSSDILLPAGARWWYVRTDAARRTYRAELGVMLPSGEFRRLAESNTVVTPRVGPSPERARRRMSYGDASELAPAAAAAAGRADREQGLASEPWATESVDAGAPARAEQARTARGGASDAFRPGGASDAFKR